tara:strand:- start:655 stop:1014 length:360 start_codon:yes stop_codon:yes gene_type:complete
MDFILFVLPGLVSLMIVLWLINNVPRFFSWSKNKSSEVYEFTKPKIEEFSTKVKDLTASEEKKLLNIDNEFFEIAQKELNSDKKIEGLWIKAGLLSENNIEIQKSIYIKLRAKELFNDK